MKIRKRLALQFTLLVALLLLIIFTAIYYYSASFAAKAFTDKLAERAIIVAQIFLKKDELPADKYAIVEKKYLQTLPGEIVNIYDPNNHAAFVSNSNVLTVDSSLLNQIRVQSSLAFRVNNRACYGIYFLDNQGDFVIIVSALNTEDQERLRSLLLFLTACFIISSIGLYFAGSLFAKQALNPIEQSVTQVNRITASNLHLRLPVKSEKDELDRLSMTFNDMLNRLENSFNVQKDFVSNASHELRTPLTAMIGELEVAITKNRTEQEYRILIQSLLDGSNRLKKITDSLLELSKVSGENYLARFEKLRIDELLVEVQQEANEARSQQKVIIQFLHLPEDTESLEFYVNKLLLKMALENILDNACKFSNGQNVTMTLDVLEKKFLITIGDKGIGIPAEAQGYIFESFYRASNARAYNGFGIGLSLVKKIIDLHQGTINVRSKESEGTSIIISLPKTDKQ